MDKPMQPEPAYFTIAQIQYNQVINLDHYVPGIQDRLRKEGYTEFERPQDIKISDPEHRREFIFDSRSLALQTTHNTTSGDFHGEWMKGVRAIHEHMKPEIMQQLGLRQLHVASSDNSEHALTRLFANSLKQLQANIPPPATLAYSRSQTGMLINDIYVINNMSINAFGKFEFPESIQAQSLKVADYFRGIEGEHIVMDVEVSSLQESGPFDLEHIDRKMLHLHGSIGQFFKSSGITVA